MELQNYFYESNFISGFIIIVQSVPETEQVPSLATNEQPASLATQQSPCQTQSVGQLTQLNEQQLAKLQSELDVVQGNMRVLSEMLAHFTNPDQNSKQPDSADIELLNVRILCVFCYLFIQFYVFVFVHVRYYVP